MSANITRLCADTGIPFHTDDVGSAYINRLLVHVQAGEKLAKEVSSLNPNCLSLGAGKMAYLQELAAYVQTNELCE